MFHSSIGCSQGGKGGVINVELVKNIDQNDAEYPDKIYAKFDMNMFRIKKSASVLVERGPLMKAEEDVVRPTR